MHHVSSCPEHTGCALRTYQPRAVNKHEIGETRNQDQFTFQTTIRLTSCADVLCAPLLNGFCLRCLVYWLTWLPSPQVSNRHLWGVLSGTEERPSHPISGTVGRDRRIAVLRDRPEGS